MRRFCALILLSGLAAASGFGVAPPVVNLKLPPGGRAAGTLTVFARDPALRLLPSRVDFRFGPEGEVELLPPGTLPRSLSPYLEIPGEAFAAGPQHELRYRVAFPEAAKGCYHAGLLLRPLTPPPRARGLRLATRVGFLVMFFVNTEGNAKPALRIVEARRTPGGLEAWIENAGSACLHVRAGAQALGPDGEAIQRWTLLEDYLLPGGSRRITAELPWPEEAVALRLWVEAPGARPAVWEVGR